MPWFMDGVPRGGSGQMGRAPSTGAGHHGTGTASDGLEVFFQSSPLRWKRK